MTWAVRRRNGGIDANEEMEDALDEPPLVDRYGEWIEVVTVAEAVQVLQRAGMHVSAAMLIDHFRGPR